MARQPNTAIRDSLSHRSSFRSMTTNVLPRWSVADVHESFDSRSFLDAMERIGADVTRLEALFDERNVRAVDPRKPSTNDGLAADDVIAAFNAVSEDSDLLLSYIYATVSTNSLDERAQSLFSEIEVLGARLTPLLARLAEWVASLDADALARTVVVVIPVRIFRPRNNRSFVRSFATIQRTDSTRTGCGRARVCVCGHLLN